MYTDLATGAEHACHFTGGQVNDEAGSLDRSLCGFTVPLCIRERPRSIAMYVMTYFGDI